MNTLTMNQTFTKCLQTRLALLDCDLTPSTRSNAESSEKVDLAPHTPRKVKDMSSEEECCTCGLPNKKYCMLASLSRKEREHRRKIVWAPMSICKVL